MWIRVAFLPLSVIHVLAPHTDAMSSADELTPATVEGQDPSQHEKRQKRSRKKTNRFIPFHAVISVNSPVRLLSDPVEHAEIQIAGETLTVPLKRTIHAPLPEVVPDQAYHLRLWFRTPEGFVDQLHLSTLGTLREGKDPSQPPTFQVAGRVQEINRDEGYLVIGIEPNAKGILEEPFSVQIWAALEQLERRDLKPGRTLMVDGTYRPGSGRLIARRITAVRVGERPKVNEDDTAPPKDTEVLERSTSQPEDLS